jgi:hypothetical protein
MAEDIPRVDARALTPQSFAAGNRAAAANVIGARFSIFRSLAATAARHPVIFTGVDMGPCAQVAVCIVLLGTSLKVWAALDRPCAP